MIISRTPYRISFLGGGTDYPGWYRQHGGSVLATTIDKYCYLSCRHLPPFFDHRYRVVYSRIESSRDIEQITHPAVRETLRHLGFDRGVEIHHDGDLPARSGMGSSAAFTVGLLNALYALQGRMAHKHQLATEAIHIEQDLIRETVGSQDQVAAAYGGLNHVTFAPNGEIAVRPMTLSRQRMEEFNSHLLLFYTGIKRTAADVADSYVRDIGARKRQLRIMGDLVNEGVSILSGGHDLHHFGELLHEAWQAKRGLSTVVSNAHIEDIYGQALAAGAIGGKLLGAGGGGFMLFFAPPEAHAAIQARLDRLIQVPFKFEASGSQIIFFDAERDYGALDMARATRPLPTFTELVPGAL